MIKNNTKLLCWTWQVPGDRGAAADAVGLQVQDTGRAPPHHGGPGEEDQRYGRA